MVSTMKMVDTKKRIGQTGSVSGVRINRTGRRTYTLDYKRDVVRQCREPGVSVAAVAMQNGINANLVRRWMVRQRRELVAASTKPQSAMLPVAIAATPPLPVGPNAGDDVPASGSALLQPRSKSSFTAHAFICAVALMPMRYAACSTC